MKGRDPKQLESHFAFGANWRDFAGTIGEGAVEMARESLARLLATDDLAGRGFLDVGCGSGLSSLAALGMGAALVRAVDIDPESTRTTSRLLERFAPDGEWRARIASVFDLDPESTGTFDIVYSWGVLHHTGAMEEAVRRTARFVAPDGVFVLALYRKTPCCGLWRLETRLYSRSPRLVQGIIAGVYRAVYSCALLATLRSPRAYARDFRNKRGMSWTHDIHDWLGGYPYESISEAEVESLAKDMGFRILRRFTKKPGLGILGSGCDQYVLAR